MTNRAPTGMIEIPCIFINDNLIRQIQSRYQQYMNINRINTVLILLLFCLLSGNKSLAQRNGSGINASGDVSGEQVQEPISFEEILDRLINAPDSLIIYNNESIDLGNYPLRKIDRLFTQANIDSGFLVLNKSLVFKNCRISGKGLSDLNINSISFENCRITSLNISWS